MLNEQQVKGVLAVVSAYDNRELGQALVSVWSEAARRGRWTFDEAVEAVHDHYANRSEWLMPGAVTQRIKTVRQDAAMRELPAAPVVNAIGQQRVRELVAAGLPDAPDGAVGPPAQPDRRLARACPYCQAQPDQPCTRAGRAGPVALASIHPSRTEETS